jgi:hypothetical protein
MRPDSFLVVEIPSLTTPLAAFMAGEPRLVLDVAMRTQPAPGNPGMMCVARASGRPKARLLELLLRLQQNYPGTQVLEPPSAEGVWVASFFLPPHPRDATAQAVWAFTADHGLHLKWVRVEEGACYLRALVPDPDQAQDLAARCRGYLEALGLDADVSVDRVPADRVIEWMEELRRATA